MFSFLQHNILCEGSNLKLDWKSVAASVNMLQEGRWLRWDVSFSEPHQRCQFRDETKWSVSCWNRSGCYSVTNLALLLNPALRGAWQQGGRQGAAASPATAESKKEGQSALAEGVVFNSISVPCKYRQNQCQRTDFKHSCEFNSLAQPVC